MVGDELAAPRPAPGSEPTYLYRLDPESKLPIIVGKVFVDMNNDGWARIDSEALAEGVGVENIDGVALVSHAMFESLETT